jgi:hypothetical protein
MVSTFKRSENTRAGQQDLKRKYDPLKMFNHNFNVLPQAFTFRCSLCRDG